MSDRLDTLLGKMGAALTLGLDYTVCTEHVLRECRAVLRLALAELPLIREQYEREIAELKAEVIRHAQSFDGMRDLHEQKVAELKAEIKNLQGWIDENELRIDQLEEEITKLVEQGE